MENLPSSVYFLLAEDMREEQGNKQTLLGFFGGDEFRVGPKDSIKFPLVMPSLVIIALLKGQFTNVPTRVKLLSPKGITLTDTEHHDVSSGLGKAAAVVLRLSPFTIEEPGEFKFELTLNKTIYPYSFRIEIES